MPKAHDITGQRFGRLLVLRLEMQGKKRYWRCRCDCGTEKTVKTRNLLFCKTQSCGCLKVEVIKRGGNLRHGLAYSSTHAIWAAMKSRCSNPNVRGYNRYGGRGISVCERWRESFVNFVADMGERPPGTSLDRIDTNGNYTPENCRWATQLVQANNTRTNRFITFNGKTQTLAEWGREMGIPAPLIGERLRRRKWPIERALTTPKQG